MSTEHQQQPNNEESRSSGSAANRAGRPVGGLRPDAGGGTGVKYFLGIAIDKYEHWPQLRNAKRDVQAVAAVLKEKFGYQEEHISLLTDSEASRENIIARLDAYEARITRQDTLVIYFAGHGHLKKGKNEVGYWVPVEGKLETTASYISNATALEHISNIDSLHTFVIVDACFSGIMLKRGGEKEEVRNPQELLGRPSRWALCSGRHDEAVDDGPNGQHSPFAGSILRKLRSHQEDYLLVGDLVREVRKVKIRGQQPDGGPLRQLDDEDGGEFAFEHVEISKKPADELAWGKITAMPQETLNQVNTKIVEVESFCNTHAESSFCHEAIRLGIALEARREYLKVKDSRSSFVLLDFLRSYPNSPYEAEIRKKLEEINIGSTPPPPAPPPEPEPPPPAEPKVSPVSAPVPPTEPIATSKPITEPVQGEGHNSSREQQEVWIKRAAIAIVVIAVLSLGSYVVRNLTGGGSEKEPQQTAQLPDSTPADPAEGAASDVGQQGNEPATSPTPAKDTDQKDGTGQQTAAVVQPPSRSKPTEETRQVDTRQENPRPVEPPRRPDPEPEPIANPASLAGTFVLVQGGSFDMGCTSEQQNCYDREKPVHRVTLGSYYIGQYEVTQAQWRAVMGNNPSSFQGCDQCPVEQVSWNDVQDFIRRLNQRTGQSYRLPTEAEWEFAARGGNRSQGYQYAGGGNPGDVGWYYGNSGSKTHPVGQKRANELGLYDMSGNVWEWCQDWYGNYSASAQTNPTGPSTGSVRVDRGGSWYSDPQGCRVARRDFGGPGGRNDFLGFRLARTP